MLDESEEDILKDIKCPQMFMPGTYKYFKLTKGTIHNFFDAAGADDPNVKAGGLGKDILGDGVEIIEFKDMQHGWTVRGDLVRTS